MAATILENSPSSLTQEEAKLARNSSVALARHLHEGESLKLRIVDAEQEEVIILPAAAVALLLGILRMMATGVGFTLIPIHSELTTKQAADILNVSRPFVIKLLDAGEIPHHKVGRHRRIRREDVMNYQRKLRHEREAILEKMVAEAQEMGRYD